MTSWILLIATVCMYHGCGGKRTNGTENREMPEKVVLGKDVATDPLRPTNPRADPVRPTKTTKPAADAMRPTKRTNPGSDPIPPISTNKPAVPVTPQEAPKEVTTKSIGTEAVQQAIVSGEDSSKVEPPLIEIPPVPTKTANSGVPVTLSKELTTNSAGTEVMQQEIVTETPQVERPPNKLPTNPAGTEETQQEIVRETPQVERPPNKLPRNPAGTEETQQEIVTETPQVERLLKDITNNPMQPTKTTSPDVLLPLTKDITADPLHPTTVANPAVLPLTEIPTVPTKTVDPAAIPLKNVRPAVLVRPPKWIANPNRAYTPMSDTSVRVFKTRQAATLEMFRVAAAAGNWNTIHHNHYDWWQFPIDDGRLPEFNLNNENEIARLKSDAEWLDHYKESIRLVAFSWSWDVDQEKLVTNNGSWDKHDVRLAKIIRSLWLFQEPEYFVSMQKFAKHVHDVLYEGKRGFYYNGNCLDEILYMQLPRN